MERSLAEKQRLFEELYATYNRPEFIHPDPLEFLHSYQEPSDREIVGLIAASLAYGRVAQIISSVSFILDKMGPSPREFLESVSRRTLSRSFTGFKHRFTTTEELIDFMLGIQQVIRTDGTLHRCFLKWHDPDDPDTVQALQSFVDAIRSSMGSRDNSLLPCPAKMSACKRLHLFLRWMIRKDEVDPGGWRNVSPSKLIIPLDTHMHRIGLLLGMTQRKQSDLKTALEITREFRKIVPDDPVKYDFALTRLGIRDDADLSVLMEPRGHNNKSKNPARGVCYG
jgi:uncharacterized protein (TIGR02757 family)